MISTDNLDDELVDPDFISDESILEEFLAKPLKRKMEQVREEGREEDIYSLILKNYRHKNGAKPSESLNEKIFEIGYYPALEDVQLTVWTTKTTAEFEREVESIRKKYAQEIEARREKTRVKN